jgi:iron(III) transport system permease protein
MVMRVVRWVARWAGTGLWVAVLAPALALVPGAVLDRAPDGTVRFTLFPLALAALDPLIWDSARNSLAAALAVTLGSLVLGTAVARVVVRRRFWGRSILAALVVAPLVVPPFLGAIGLMRLSRALPVWARPGIGAPAGWIGWVWVGMAAGMPLVALAVGSALARSDPAWEDAARLAGASERRIWWQLVWPGVRPAAARAAALVFTLTLIEPGAPLVLGLRRTLAFQVVDAATGTEPVPRAVVLAAIATALAGVARGLLRVWGRGGATPPEAAGMVVLRPAQAGWLRTAVSVASLGLVAALGWLPLSCLLAPELSGSGSFWRRPFLAVDPDVSRLALNSLALGGATVAIDLALSWTLASWGGRRHPWVLALASWPELFPPLALGVGALALPELLRMGADWAGPSGGGAAFGRGARVLAGELDVYRTPGILLALAVAAVRLPFLARAVEQGWTRFRPALIDAALLLGATPRRAGRTATGLWLGAAPAALLLTFALAATNLAPALVLASTFESRTVCPAILTLADEPGTALNEAAVLAAAAVGVNLVALGLAAASRSVRLGEWFGG